MTADDGQLDHVLANVASLRTHDVSRGRARQLRRQCHAELQRWTTGPARTGHGMSFRRVVGPALGGAWCLVYLLEIARAAAAVYLLPP